MAAKHDGKHARANMWVTHQNLARAKGGRPHYQYKEKAARAQKPATAASSDPSSTSTEAKPDETAASASAPAADRAAKP